MFRRILVANRGEIALRILRTCRALGVETVAAYSDADAQAPHLAAADHVERIGPAAAAKSYLNASRLIDAARRAGADAVHPGYGFLAESAAFAAACGDAGLAFIGPAPDVIACAGSKVDARRLARRSGVAVVPGCEPRSQADADIRAALDEVGYPALLKPAAGGGGKGMRIVDGPAAATAAIAASRREALAACGDGSLYVERQVDRPRHVEVQVVGDRHGNLVHLGERDCSVQRRYQKVIEECPAPGLTDSLRAELAASALRLAAAAGCDNAATIEFLLEPAADGARFYFLEMNTRLQVEHPVTELTTGVDLVRAQIEIAAGAPLAWTPPQLEPRGHAIECRVYAEDPASGYLPQTGRITLYEEPAGPGIRVDAGVAAGSEVTVHYDPLLAKVVAHGEQRDWARARLLDALRQYVVLGVTTNLGLLQQVLRHPRFVAGDADTGLLEREHAALAADCGEDALTAALAAAAAALGQPAEPPEAPAPAAATHHEAAAADPWTDLAGWRIGGAP